MSIRSFVLLSVISELGAGLRLRDSFQWKPENDKLPTKIKGFGPPEEIFYEGQILPEVEVRRMLKNSSVVFMVPLGPNRNDNINYVRANIERVGNLFRSFSVVVGTPAGESGETSAKTWQKQARDGPTACHDHLCFADQPYDVKVATHEKTIAVECSLEEKACRAARGRDAILQTIFNTSVRAEYAISVDSDMSRQWNLQGFIKAFSLADNWSMIAANGIKSSTGVYADWLAWKSSETYSKRKIFDPEGKALKVYGAYGGLAIYRLESLRGCKHTCHYNQKGIHLTELNCIDDCITNKNENLYMHPGLIIEWEDRQSSLHPQSTWNCGEKLCDPPTYTRLKPN